MADYNKINVSIGGYHVMAQSISVNQSSPNTPLYALNNVNAFNTAPTPVKSTVGISYFAEIDNDPNIVLISGWKNNTTGTLRQIINIGESSFFAHLNSYSFDLLSNQLLVANADYDVYGAIPIPFSNQFTTNTGSYDSTNGSGIIHAWNSKFLAGGVPIDNTDILQFSYNFSAQLKPIYKIGSSSPIQVAVLSAAESIKVVGEVQNNIQFLGELFSDLYGIDLIRLSGFNNSGYLDIPLTGFLTQTNTSSIENDSIILFNTEFNKYY